MARRRVWAFGFGHIAGCEAPAGPHGPQKQMASTVTYWAICASASNSLTRDAHVTDDTARHLRYTSRAKREADVSLSHRCTMEHHDATGVSPRDKRCEKHQLKWMLS